MITEALLIKPLLHRPRPLRTIAAFCRRLTREMFNTYHPERHYMRGPGPKWQAKHGLASAGR